MPTISCNESLGEVSGAITALSNATKEINMSENVTAFTASNFSRNFVTNGEGTYLPKTSVDQYIATMTNWFTVTGTDLNEVFPHPSRFPTADLDLMAGMPSSTIGEASRVFASETPRRAFKV
jgi:uncharacterized protein (DUF1501 family)